MKVIRNPAEFRPLTIVLESQAEIDDVYLLSRVSAVGDTYPVMRLIFTALENYASPEATSERGNLFEDRRVRLRKAM